MITPTFKYFEELESTNTYAMNNILSLNDMDIIVASRQTCGRGRFNRNWVSGKNDNVYMSIVLKPCKTINDNQYIANISQYMSVVICRVLMNYGIKPEIKWPNDILVNGKKISGILCETSIQGSFLKGIVLGIGINLNLEENDLKNINQPATSLNFLTGNQINKIVFINKLVLEFIHDYQLFLEQGFRLIKGEYIEKCDFIGKNIRITNLNSARTALAKGINDNGELIIVENKKESTVNVGDISF
jgi:BirA family biotin operon repressor/biotin-[acetyl-CoA-carboxylase] ligase